jgi:hypothetical protein
MRGVAQLCESVTRRKQTVHRGIHDIKSVKDEDGLVKQGQHEEPILLRLRFRTTRRADAGAAGYARLGCCHRSASLSGSRAQSCLVSRRVQKRRSSSRAPSSDGVMQWVSLRDDKLRIGPHKQHVPFRQVCLAHSAWLDPSQPRRSPPISQPCLHLSSSSSP